MRGHFAVREGRGGKDREEKERGREREGRKKVGEEGREEKTGGKEKSRGGREEKVEDGPHLLHPTVVAPLHDKEVSKVKTQYTVALS